MAYKAPHQASFIWFSLLHVCLYFFVLMMIAFMFFLLVPVKWLVEKSGFFAPVKRLTGKTVSKLTYDYIELHSSQPTVLV